MGTVKGCVDFCGNAKVEVVCECGYVTSLVGTTDECRCGRKILDSEDNENQIVEIDGDLE